MKYKVGDKVRVRLDLIIRDDFPAPGGKKISVQSSMAALAGEVVTISDVMERHLRYSVAEDKGGWAWTDDMFIGKVIDVEPEPEEGEQRKYKPGDKVRLRNDLRYHHYDDILCTYKMASHAGEVVTISAYRGEKSFLIKEHLSDCNPEWLWSEGMVEGLADAEPEPLDTDWNWEDLF
jgi:hypothetical protein